MNYFSYINKLMKTPKRIKKEDNVHDLLSVPYLYHKIVTN